MKARSHCAIVREVSLTLALLILSESQGWSAGVALPAPGWLRGNDGLVAEVSRLLAQHEGPSFDDGTAAHFVVVVRAQGDAVKARAEWPDGSEIERTATTPAMIATWIESLERRDLADSLLAPRKPPGSSAPVAVVPAVASVVSQAPPPSRFFVGVDGSVSAGTDASVAAGIALSSCLLLGRACLGVRARFMDQFVEASGDRATSKDPSEVSVRRSYADLMATMEVPIAAGRWRWIPGAGFGARVVSAHAEVGTDQSDSRLWGPTGCLSVDAVRVWGNGLALVAGFETQLLVGRIIDGTEFEQAWFSGQPRLSGLFRAGVRFYP